MRASQDLHDRIVNGATITHREPWRIVQFVIWKDAELRKRLFLTEGPEKAFGMMESYTMTTNRLAAVKRTQVILDGVDWVREELPTS